MGPVQSNLCIHDLDNGTDPQQNWEELGEGAAVQSNLSGFQRWQRNITQFHKGKYEALYQEKE